MGSSGITVPTVQIIVEPGQWAEVDGNGFKATLGFVLDAAYQEPKCMITLGAYESDIGLYRDHMKHLSENKN